MPASRSLRLSRSSNITQKGNLEMQFTVWEANSLPLYLSLCSAVFSFWKKNIVWFVNALLELLMVD